MSFVTSGEGCSQLKRRPDPFGWPFSSPSSSEHYIVVTCWDCGTHVEVPASWLDEEAGSPCRAPDPLRAIGWKRLPMGEDFALRCPACRLDFIEACPTVLEEIG